jgi:hypothetical protein
MAIAIRHKAAIGLGKEHPDALHRLPRRFDDHSLDHPILGFGGRGLIAPDRREPQGQSDE